MCAVNDDSDLACGTMSGLYFIQIQDNRMLRTDELYLKDLNVWCVKEVAHNIVIVTCWLTANTYLINRSEVLPKKKPLVLEEPSTKNNHATDLILIPGYDFNRCPYVIKRAKKSVTLIDIRQLKQYTLYEDQNAEFGYSKMATRDLGNDAFEILYVASEGKNKTVIKRFQFASYYKQGLRKISNLKHRV